MSGQYVFMVVFYLNESVVVDQCFYTLIAVMCIMYNFSTGIYASIWRIRTQSKTEANPKMNGNIMFNIAIVIQRE